MRIVSRTLIFCLFLFLGSALSAQVRIDCSNSCSFIGSIPETETYGFDSDREAEDALSNIMKHTGLPRNFKLMAGNVPNAAAIIRCDEETNNCDRYIIYNQNFMRKVKQTTKTDWSAVSILAHEIGHHLSGHTLLSGGSRPRLELEADKFSGFILYNLGASLEEALIAIKTLVGEQGSATHPGRSARVAAITNGWIQASEINPSTPERTPETASNEPIRNNSVPGRGAYWRHDGAKQEYALYVNGTPIARRCEKAYSNDDYLVFDPQQRVTYLLEDFRHRADNQYREARILGSGPSVYWRHNGAGNTYALYVNGNMISQRVKVSYSEDNYVAYDPQTRTTYLLENFKSLDDNTLRRGRILGTGNSVFWRHNGAQNVYALYVNGDHVSSRCAAAYSGNNYLVYDPQTRTTFLLDNFKHQTDNSLRSGRVLGRGASIYWRHDGAGNTYALYVNGESIASRCEARYEGDDYVVFDPQDQQTYRLEDFRNRKDNKLRVGRIQ